MNFRKVFKKQRVYIALLVAFSLVLFFFLQLPLFQNFNNLFVDPLLGEITARKEVVIVGIDDKSLQQVGAWPWSRDVFADAFKNISAQKPVAVGIDVLFLESRSGDDEFLAAIESNDVPVVVGSKISSDVILRSVYEGKKNVYSGFVNFAPDLDGKIRDTQVFEKNDNECEVSFGLALTAQYFKEDSDTLCDRNLKLRNNSYSLDSKDSLQFSYTKESFSQISFADVLNNNFSADYFKDKIVLIGSTALDVRSELNDNFTDIFGETIPGVQIHANIVNSFLQNNFFSQAPAAIIISLYLLLAAIFGFLFIKAKKALYDFLIMILFQVINLGLTLVLINFGTIMPFIQIALFIFGIYIFSLSYRYLTKTRENQYVKTIFSRYLNKDLMNILLQNSDKLKLGGETRKMTVMFSDIRSFTTISEGLTPHQLVEMLNDYLSYMTDIILRNKGTVDKYIGDAIMAFWNAPLDDEYQTSHAIKTALEMKVQLAEFGKMHPEYPEIKIGIGLNFGEMTVGNVGGKDRFDYTVLGDNVNLGSRLEGLTKKYGVTVIVSESAKESYENEYQEWSKIKDSYPTKFDADHYNYSFRLLDDMKVKGKNDSVKIYEPFKKSDFEKNKTILDTYNKGFELYQQGKFAEALSTLQKNTDDKASALLAERVQGLIDNPPTDWHGIWKWEEK